MRSSWKNRDQGGGGHPRLRCHDEQRAMLISGGLLNILKEHS
ncbi:MAG: hypothetical protein ACOXZ7_03325 [Sphaerochaeta sp.]